MVRDWVLSRVSSVRCEPPANIAGMRVAGLLKEIAPAPAKTRLTPLLHGRAARYTGEVQPPPKISFFNASLRV